MLGLTARQLAILTATASVVGLLGWLVHQVLPGLPLPVLAVVGLPPAVAGAVLAFGQRDGISMDRMIWAALQHARTRDTLAPLSATDRLSGAGPRDRAGWLLPAAGLPVRRVHDDATVDLGGDGTALVCQATTVNFALRTPAEQTALLAVMARLLHTLTGPTQLLTQTRQADLQPAIQQLNQQAPELPHPALQAAAREHAAFLTDLDQRGEVLARRVLVVFRQPAQRGARAEAAVVLRRQAEDAATVLAAAGITLTPLTRPEAIEALGVAAPTEPADLTSEPIDDSHATTTRSPQP